MPNCSDWSDAWDARPPPARGRRFAVGDRVRTLDYSTGIVRVGVVRAYHVLPGLPGTYQVSVGDGVLFRDDGELSPA